MPGGWRTGGERATETDGGWRVDGEDEADVDGGCSWDDVVPKLSWEKRQAVGGGGGGGGSRRYTGPGQVCWRVVGGGQRAVGSGVDNRKAPQRTSTHRSKGLA